LSGADWLPHTAAAEDYEREAAALHEALRAGSDEARWPFKWEHPRFRGRHVSEVPADLPLDEARLVIARRYAFGTWSDLLFFAAAVGRDPAVATFEAAVEAVVSGDLSPLRSMLRDDAGLARARSSRRHRATLLHYIAANGVEGGRQRTPANAVEVARTLLEAGADPNAIAHMDDADCTTMSLLVSSSPPAEAGLQAALAETLLDHGADASGRNPVNRSAVLTALAFGFQATAQALARRGASSESLAEAAGLGWPAEVARLLPRADAGERRIALALAAQHGHAAIVRLLLDAGVDPNLFNPEGCHAHSTPLHQAAWAGHAEAVRLLVERGARLDLRDGIYDGTPLDWAMHGGRTAIADFLRGRR
jgi:ankyrin repeat protein